MKIFNFDCHKLNKKYIIAYIIAILLGIISGIVLYTLNCVSSYMYDFADNYIYYIFNFNNGALFFTRLFSELFYLYILFFICGFTKLKLISLPVLFLRTLLSSLYAVILLSLFATEGLFVALVVYIPSNIITLIISVFICEYCKAIAKPYSFIAPLALSVLSSLLLLVIVNTLFRFIVVIA